ncbi:hypothetical protein DFJ74DRAFT_372616 [Hyaloraphidium curvatum]|nr:hypothetical protein DFJ74DRAFT_372616 [Hyaloraphidium curvatum]
MSSDDFHDSEGEGGSADAADDVPTDPDWLPLVDVTSTADGVQTKRTLSAEERAELLETVANDLEAVDWGNLSVPKSADLLIQMAARGWPQNRYPEPDRGGAKAPVPFWVSLAIASGHFYSHESFVRARKKYNHLGSSLGEENVPYHRLYVADYLLEALRGNMELRNLADNGLVHVRDPSIRYLETEEPPYRCLRCRKPVQRDGINKGEGKKCENWPWRSHVREQSLQEQPNVSTIQPIAGPSSSKRPRSVASSEHDVDVSFEPSDDPPRGIKLKLRVRQASSQLNRIEIHLNGVEMPPLRLRGRSATLELTAELEPEASSRQSPNKAPSAGGSSGSGPGSDAGGRSSNGQHSGGPSGAPGTGSTSPSSRTAIVAGGLVAAALMSSAASIPVTLALGAYVAFVTWTAAFGPHMTVHHEGRVALDGSEPERESPQGGKEQILERGQGDVLESRPLEDSAEVVDFSPASAAVKIESSQDVEEKEISEPGEDSLSGSQSLDNDAEVANFGAGTVPAQSSTVIELVGAAISGNSSAPSSLPFFSLARSPSPRLATTGIRFDGSDVGANLKATGNQEYEKIDGGAHVNIDGAGSIKVGKIDGMSNSNLVASSIEVREFIDGKSTTTLVARDGSVVIGTAGNGKIDGKSKVRIWAAKDIIIKGKIDGESEVELRAENGDVLVEGKVDGRCTIKYQAKSFAILDKTGGNVKVIDLRDNTEHNAREYFK